MCGTDGNLFRTKIENTYLNVCQECTKHGEVMEPVEAPKPLEERPIKAVIERGEIIQIIIPNYSTVVKNSRELMNLKQKELAQKIAEKESVIHNVESGHTEPSIDLARKLEKFLSIKLVTQYIEKGGLEKPAKGEAMTIGDMIKLKK